MNDRHELEYLFRLSYFPDAFSPLAPIDTSTQVLAQSYFFPEYTGSVTCNRE